MYICTCHDVVSVRREIPDPAQVRPTRRGDARRLPSRRPRDPFRAHVFVTVTGIPSEKIELTEVALHGIPSGKRKCLLLKRMCALDEGDALVHPACGLGVGAAPRGGSQSNELSACASAPATHRGSGRGEIPLEGASRRSASRAGPPRGKMPVSANLRNSLQNFHNNCAETCQNPGAQNFLHGPIRRSRLKRRRGSRASGGEDPLPFGQTVKP